MSGANTKKKMKAIANQFEDAEEPSEDMEVTSPSKEEDETKEEEDETKEEDEAKDDASATKEEDAQDPPVTKSKVEMRSAKDAPEKVEEEKEDDNVEEEKVSSPSGTKPEDDTEADEEPTTTTPPSTSPPPPDQGSDSPLDALASACAAEKLLKQQKQKILQPNPPKEGTKVRADEISCTDVLCGRGGQSNHHPGNIFFRRLVRAKQEEYLKANKREKTVVAKDIVKLIRLLTPAGRFLKKDTKDDSFYVDVGDVQARNKASQALREGAPELREELRDQHSRLNAQNGGGPEVKLPYHGHKGSASSNNEDRDGGRKGISRKEREALAARAAAAQGLMLPHFGVGGPEGMVPAALRGGTDPPEGSEDEADPSTHSASSSKAAAVSAAAMHAAAAEERARRLMLAGGAPGLGPAAHMLNPHLAGLGGLGGAHHMNPFLAAHHSPAAAAQLAALQAGGANPFLSHQALMMAAAAGHAPPNAAMLLQASRARELAHMEAAGYGAAAGVNPLFLGGQARAAAQAQFQDSMRLHELMASAGAAGAGGASKREREEIEREIEEKYSKAAKRTRQFPM